VNDNCGFSLPVIKCTVESKANEILGGDKTMKSLITSNLRRQGRALVPLALGVAVLIWLLGVWSGLPTAEARGPAAANPDTTSLALSSSDTITYYVFLPLIFKSDVIFFDDFSDPNSGWPNKETYENCYYEYYGGRYRVKVSENGQRCIVPKRYMPKQVNGTFIVKVRRTSNEDRHMLYGLIFGAGTNAVKNRWALEVYPNKDSKCSNKPFYWLVALVDGDGKYFRDKCTDTIDTDKDDWNELKVIRNGKNIKVYINGESKGEYNDADYLRDEGYSLLEVVSASDEDIYVEFDDFTILSRTTP
jgi:hypothetical protein